MRTVTTLVTDVLGYSGRANLQYQNQCEPDLIFRLTIGP